MSQEAEVVHMMQYAAKYSNFAAAIKIIQTLRQHSMEYLEELKKLKEQIFGFILTIVTFLYKCDTD